MIDTIMNRTQILLITILLKVRDFYQYGNYILYGKLVMFNRNHTDKRKGKLHQSRTYIHIYFI